VPSRRARPGALALLTLVWASLLLGWLQLTPLYRAPDETHHVDLVLRLRDGESYPPPGELDLDPKVRASYPLAGLSSEARPELASLYPLPLRTTDVPDRDASFDELRPTPGLAPIPNQMTQHPPLYYGLLAGASALLPGFSGWSFAVQVGVLRVLSALLLLPVPALAAAAARRLGASRPVWLAAAVLPLGVPQLASLGASVNNDSLMVLLGAAVAAPLVAVARGDTSRRTAVLVGGLLGLALLTKALALGLLVWAALAYGAALLAPGRSARVRTLTSGLLAAGVAVLVGGWWWVANVVRFGAVQPQVLDPFPVRAFDPDLLAFTEGVVVRLTASTWGSFGWLEVRLPELAQLAGAVVLVLGVSLAVGRRAPAPGARAAAAVALAAFCVQVAVVYQQSLKNYLRGGYFAGLQGRYLFAFVAVLAALVALGLSGLLPRARQRVAPLAALAAVAVMQVVGVSPRCAGSGGRTGPACAGRWPSRRRGPRSRRSSCCWRWSSGSPRSSCWSARWSAARRTLRAEPRTRSARGHGRQATQVPARGRCPPATRAEHRDGRSAGPGPHAHRGRHRRRPRAADGRTGDPRLGDRHRPERRPRGPPRHDVAVPPEQSALRGARPRLAAGHRRAGRLVGRPAAAGQRPRRPARGARHGRRRRPLRPVPPRAARAAPRPARRRAPAHARQRRRRGQPALPAR
jgi:hypothetical protein